MEQTDTEPGQAPAESAGPDAPARQPSGTEPGQAPAESAGPDAPARQPSGTEPEQAPAESAGPDAPPENGFAGLSRDELEALALEQNSRLEGCEEKLKRSLADFANLQKKTESDIQRGVHNQTDKLFLDFLQIYDDFLRARAAFASGGTDTGGLDSILKNMDSFLARYGITEIDALGEIFDPNLHEAISIVPDPDLDDDTITKEIRKGYISHKRVIRPALVEISKKGG